MKPSLSEGPCWHYCQFSNLFRICVMFGFVFLGGLGGVWLGNSSQMQIMNLDSRFVVLGAALGMDDV